VNQAGKAGAGFGAAAVLGLLAGVAAVMTLGFALDTFMWRWLAFLIVTAVLGGIAAFLAVVSKQKLAQVNPVPEKTIETLKEDKQWLSELKS
jgi:MFS family permease